MMLEVVGCAGGNFRKKFCKILSHIAMYIIEGAILHRLQYS